MNKHRTLIDMTPMVDLGFLLISFFVITTELSKPVVMDLYMPKEGPPMALADSKALTVLAGERYMYYYRGDWKKAINSGAIWVTGRSGQPGIREIIIQTQLQLDARPADKEGRDGLMLLIKATGKTPYKRIVDILDEAGITAIRKYAIMKISVEEENWINAQDQ